MLPGAGGEQGGVVEVRVRRDGGSLVFTGDPPPRRPRHAFLPRWHFDMLGDTQRNAGTRPPPIARKELPTDPHSAAFNT